MKTRKSISRRSWPGITNSSGLLAVMTLAYGLSGCSTLDRMGPGAAAGTARFEADVAQAEAWAQSPVGQALLNDLAAGVKAYVAATGGGTKSQANAAAIGAAVRSLETGKAPDLATVAAAVSNYVPSGTSREVVKAIVASATAGPNVNGGLEVAAKTIDATTAPGVPPAPALAQKVF